MNIRTKLIGIIVIWLTFAGIIFSIFFINNQKKNELTRLNDKINTTNLLLNQVNTRPLYDLGIDELKINLESFLKDPELISITLTEYNGNINLHFESPKVEAAKLIEDKTILTYNNQKIGEINTTFSTHLIDKKIKGDVSLIFLFVGILILGIALVSYWIVNRITFPLSSLTGVMGEVTKKENFTIRAITQSNDEIGSLCKDFNTMLDYIEENRRVIKKTNAELIIALEKAKKSKALEIANEKLQEEEKKQRKLNNELQTSEEELIQLNEELSATNNQLFSQKEQLKSTIDKLKITQTQLVQSEKMASLGVLTAGIAHEINNPVNFIFAGINSLQKDFDDISIVLNEIEKLNYEDTNLKEKIKHIEKLKQEYYYNDAFTGITETINDIRIGADRTTEIVKGLRTFSRIEKNSSSIFDIHEGIDAALLLLKNRYKSHVEIIKNYDKALPKIECFPGKLNQVFMNIISNAIDAIKKKGTISITTQKINDDVMVKIKDNGEGISEEARSKIFDPFFTTKTVGKGTGLGMAISFGIIQEHGGKINVLSKQGEGTEIIVYLPIIK